MWARGESGPKALHFAGYPLKIWEKNKNNNKRCENFLLFILFYFICGNFGEL